MRNLRSDTVIRARCGLGAGWPSSSGTARRTSTSRQPGTDGGQGAKSARFWRLARSYTGTRRPGGHPHRARHAVPRRHGAPTSRAGRQAAGSRGHGLGTNGCRILLDDPSVDRARPASRVRAVEVVGLDHRGPLREYAGRRHIYAGRFVSCTAFGSPASFTPVITAMFRSRSRSPEATRRWSAG